MISKEKVERNVETVVAVINFLELLTHHAAVRHATTVARMTTAAIAQLRDLLSREPVQKQELEESIARLHDTLADHDAAADDALARKFGRRTDPPDEV